MMARHLVQRSQNLFTVPVFLAPAFATTTFCASIDRSFSSSPITYKQVKRGNRDKNKKRGVSAIRSTGPRQTVSVQRLGPLPKPVSDPTEARASFEVNASHGLWGFFNENKEAMIPPSEEDSHGRSWTIRELSKKSFEDLHKLYWVCIKEMNVVRTRNNERRRLRLGYGHMEGQERIQSTKKTMHRIRQVLLDRHYAHFDARLLLDQKWLHEIFPDVLHQNVSEEALGLEGDVMEKTLPYEETAAANKSSTANATELRLDQS